MMQKPKSLFQKTAEQAAILEKNGNLIEAAQWWRDAHDMAKNSKNQHWCAIRNQRCQYEQELRRKRAVGGQG